MMSLVNRLSSAIERCRVVKRLRVAEGENRQYETLLAMCMERISQYQAQEEERLAEIERETAAILADVNRRESVWEAAAMVNRHFDRALFVAQRMDGAHVSLAVSTLLERDHGLRLALDLAGKAMELEGFHRTPEADVLIGMAKIYEERDTRCDVGRAVDELLIGNS